MADSLSVSPFRLDSSSQTIGQATTSVGGEQSGVSHAKTITSLRDVKPRDTLVELWYNQQSTRCHLRTRTEE